MAVARKEWRGEIFQSSRLPLPGAWKRRGFRSQNTDVNYVELVCQKELCIYTSSNISFFAQIWRYGLKNSKLANLL